MVKLLGNGLYGHLLRLDLNLHRIVHERPGNVLHLGSQGCREEHGLSLGTGTQHAEHVLDIWVESHVKQSVSLIDHENIKVSEVDLPHLLVVQDPSGGGYKDVAAICNGLILLCISHPSIKTPHSEAGNV